MSTILKALKKLEQETQSTAAVTPVRGETPVAGTGSSRPKRIWIAIGISAALLSLGLVLFIFLRPTVTPSVPTPKFEPIPQPPPASDTAAVDKLPMPKVYPPPQPGDTGGASSPETVPGTQAAGGGPPSSAPADAQPKAPSMAVELDRSISASAPPVGSATPSETKRTSDSAAPPVSQPLPQAPPPQTAVAATPRPAAPSTASAPTLPPEPTTPPAEKGDQTAVAPPTPSTPEAPEDPYADVPRIEPNSPINLQAISWAQPAENSIAVINNSVLHEGDSVAGYTVVKIRPDDVILRREGRLWRASFTIR